MTITGTIFLDEFPPFWYSSSESVTTKLHFKQGKPTSEMVEKY